MSHLSSSNIFDLSSPLPQIFLPKQPTP